MRKKSLIILLSMALFATGCAGSGASTSEEPSASEASTLEEVPASEEPTSEEDPVSEESVAEEAVEAKTALPKYEYPGPEAFYFILYSYLTEELGKNYDDADVSIPCPHIIAEDESDKNDIKVYGDFWIYNYKLNGDTLENVSGGSYPGCIHIKSDPEKGYEVTGMDVVADGSEWESSAKEIFGDLYEDLIKLNENSEEKEKTRAQIIANYVFANDLDIKQYQDYGWDPVTLPEQNIDSFYSILN